MFGACPLNLIRVAVSTALGSQWLPLAHYFVMYAGRISLQMRHVSFFFFVTKAIMSTASMQVNGHKEM